MIVSSPPCACLNQGNNHEIHDLDAVYHDRRLRCIGSLGPMGAPERQEHKPNHFPHYRVTDLGTLGGMSSLAFAVNSKGQVGGGANVPGEYQHPFLWTRQTGLQDLGTLGG